MSCFENVLKNFGFGCMRLPMNGEEVDHVHFSAMVDRFLEAGFNYFDTAHGYIGGKSETALRACLTSRYPRDRYILTNKLSGWFFKTEAEIRPLFESQLAACGVEYFDFYLMHAQNAQCFEEFKAARAYETAFALKSEGKIRHVGISFHDKADVLDRILTEYPEIETVQIQFNYLDYEDDGVQGRLCYEVCRRHGKPVIIMEPVKGGALAVLPATAAEVLAALEGGSAASYAIRYTAGFEGVAMVLSGMSNLEQLEDNIGFMADFVPLSSVEAAAVQKVGDILKRQDLIKCTACRYCMDVCPQGIEIPSLFAQLNAVRQGQAVDGESNGTPASSCIECGACEGVCPQKLPIRELLKAVAEVFEK